MPTHLLLVEDNPGDALIFREKMEATDLDAALVHVDRLSEALKVLGQRAFDIALVDLSLPDAQGTESVTALRSAAPDLPIIVLTGLDDAETAAQAKRRGAADYVVKWYVDSPSLARYIRYAITSHTLLADPDARGGRPVRPLEPDTPEPAPDPAPAPASGTPEPVASPLASLQTDGAAPLVLTLEAIHAYVARTADQGQWLASVLRDAIDLVRREPEADPPRPWT